MIDAEYSYRLKLLEEQVKLHAEIIKMQKDALDGIVKYLEKYT